MNIPTVKQLIEGKDMIFYDSREIELREHDFCSSLKFKQEVKLIHSVFKDEIIDFHHLGSTSIPNLIARPIIDIGIEINSLNLLRSHISGLKKLGYLPECSIKEYGEFTFFKIGQGSYSLQIFRGGNSRLPELILFKELLKSRKELRNEYARVKKYLAAKYVHYGDKYNNGKNLFIDEVISNYHLRMIS